MTVKPVDNLIMLTEQNVNEEGILACLKERYSKDQIYTFIGNVLISVNPFRLVKKDMYSKVTMEKYRGKYPYEVAPHVFTVSEDTYRSMMSEKRDQSIIISGESGAGKTEASKQIMNYLADVSQMKGNKESETVKKQILQSNPILESFGNAKTVRNNNSSRFGKYMEIYFTYGGEICGGNITNFLLEKSRVVHQMNDERNFHIFYQLFSDNELKNKLKLTKPSDFHYLNQTECYTVNGIDDSKEFKDTKDAMNLMNFSNQDEIFELLAGILHLGNIEFEGNPKEQAKLKNKESLEIASKLLKIDSKYLLISLTTKSVAAGGRNSVYNATLDSKESSYARDALSKSLYEKLFDFIVFKINKSILKPEKEKSLIIGILDIYGFEIFKENSFEQLCINFTNEKLQQIFIELTLKAEQEEYNNENIKWTPVKYENNKPCVDMIEKKIGGLFSLLNETGLVKGDDKQFLEKINSNLKLNSFFIFDEKKNKKENFILKHYAGEVEYNSNGFIDKNSDTLFQSIIDCLKSSNSKLIQYFFPNSNEKLKVSKRPTTVSTKFIEQVDQLMKKLYSCQPHYIRCLKPNSEKKSSYFVDEEMKHQIKYLGLFENVRVRRAGFVYRQTFDFFFQRYRILSKDTFPILNKNINSNLDACKYLLKEIFKNENIEYQFGKSKLFIKKPETIFHLEELRDRALHDICKIIQRKYRGYKARKFFIEMKEKSLGIFSDDKKRRRISINRTFSGDYLELFEKAQIITNLIKSNESSKIYYSNYGDKIAKTFMGYGSLQLHSKIIFLSEKTIYICTGSKKKLNLKEKIQISSIESLTLSNLTDGYIFIKALNKIEYVLNLDSKTEFVSVLSELYERETRLPLSISFKNDYQFLVKPSIPIDISIIEGDKLIEKDILKENKKSLQITIKYEESLFGKKSNQISKINSIKSNINSPSNPSKPSNLVKSNVTSNPNPNSVKSNTKEIPSPRQKKKEITIATFQFIAQQEDELSLTPGDVITILEKNEDGWWKGESNGNIGLFPGNHCELGSE
eukprot:gene10518-3040_t